MRLSIKNINNNEKVLTQGQNSTVDNDDHNVDDYENNNRSASDHVHLLTIDRITAEKIILEFEGLRDVLSTSVDRTSHKVLKRLQNDRELWKNGRLRRAAAEKAFASISDPLSRKDRVSRPIKIAKKARTEVVARKRYGEKRVESTSNNTKKGSAVDFVEVEEIAKRAVTYNESANEEKSFDRPINRRNTECNEAFRTGNESKNENVNLTDRVDRTEKSRHSVAEYLEASCSKIETLQQYLSTRIDGRTAREYKKKLSSNLRPSYPPKAGARSVPITEIDLDPEFLKRHTNLNHLNQLLKIEEGELLETDLDNVWSIDRGEKWNCGTLEVVVVAVQARDAVEKVAVITADGPMYGDEQVSEGVCERWSGKLFEERVEEEGIKIISGQQSSESSKSSYVEEIGSVSSRESIAPDNSGRTVPNEIGKEFRREELSDLEDGGEVTLVEEEFIDNSTAGSTVDSDSCLEDRIKAADEDIATRETIVEERKGNFEKDGYAFLIRDFAMDTRATIPTPAARKQEEKQKRRLGLRRLLPSLFSPKDARKEYGGKRKDAKEQKVHRERRKQDERHFARYQENGNYTRSPDTMNLNEDIKRNVRLEPSLNGSLIEERLDEIKRELFPDRGPMTSSTPDHLSSQSEERKTVFADRTRIFKFYTADLNVSSVVPKGEWKDNNDIDHFSRQKEEVEEEEEQQKQYLAIRKFDQQQQRCAQLERKHSLQESMMIGHSNSRSNFQRNHAPSGRVSAPPAERFVHRPRAIHPMDRPLPEIPSSRIKLCRAYDDDDDDDDDDDANDDDIDDDDDDDDDANKIKNESQNDNVNVTNESDNGGCCRSNRIDFREATVAKVGTDAVDTAASVDTPMTDCVFYENSRICRSRTPSSGLQLPSQASPESSPIMPTTLVLTPVSAQVKITRHPIVKQSQRAPLVGRNTSYPSPESSSQRSTDYADSSCTPNSSQKGEFSPSSSKSGGEYYLHEMPQGDIYDNDNCRWYTDFERAYDDRLYDEAPAKEKTRNLSSTRQNLPVAVSLPSVRFHRSMKFIPATMVVHGSSVNIDRTPSMSSRRSQPNDQILIASPKREGSYDGRASTGLSSPIRITDHSEYVTSPKYRHPIATKASLHSATAGNVNVHRPEPIYLHRNEGNFGKRNAFLPSTLGTERSRNISPEQQEYYSLPSLSTSHSSTSRSPERMTYSFSVRHQSPSVCIQKQRGVVQPRSLFPTNAMSAAATTMAVTITTTTTTTTTTATTTTTRIPTTPLPPVEMSTHRGKVLRNSIVNTSADGETTNDQRQRQIYMQQVRSDPQAQRRINETLYVQRYSPSGLSVGPLSPSKRQTMQHLEAFYWQQKALEAQRKTVGMTSPISSVNHLPEVREAVYWQHLKRLDEEQQRRIYQQEYKEQQQQQQQDQRQQQQRRRQRDNTIRAATEQWYWNEKRIERDSTTPIGKPPLMQGQKGQNQPVLVVRPQQAIRERYAMPKAKSSHNGGDTVSKREGQRSKSASPHLDSRQGNSWLIKDREDKSQPPPPPPMPPPQPIFKRGSLTSGTATETIDYSGPAGPAGPKRVSFSNQGNLGPDISSGTGWPTKRGRAPEPPTRRHRSEDSGASSDTDSVFSHQERRDLGITEYDANRPLPPTPRECTATTTTTTATTTMKSDACTENRWNDNRWNHDRLNSNVGGVRRSCYQKWSSSPAGVKSGGNDAETPHELQMQRDFQRREEEEWNPDGKGRQSNDIGGSGRVEGEPGSNELIGSRRTGGGSVVGLGGGGVLGINSGVGAIGCAPTGTGGGGTTLGSSAGGVGIGSNCVNGANGGGSTGNRSSGTGGRSRDEPRRHTLGGSGGGAGSDHQTSLHHQQYSAAQPLHPLHPHHLPSPHSQYGTPPTRHTTMDLEMGTKSRQRKSPLPRGYPPPSSAMLFDDDPGIMSEVETSSTGFRRGGKQRSSLPVVRTPSKTLERPLGLVFLQYRNETKRALLPNEITSIDTVKALFVRSFPKQLTMEYLDSPHVKVYIHDSNKDMFYELEDLRSHLRDIRDRSVLRLFESSDGVTGMPGPLGVPGGGGGLPPHWEDQSYFSEPEFDSEYQHQHIHKSKTVKNSASSGNSGSGGSGGTGGGGSGGGGGGGGGGGSGGGGSGGGCSGGGTNSSSGLGNGGGSSGSGYYVGGSSTLPRGGPLLRAYSPATSSVVSGPNATPTQPKALSTPGGGVVPPAKPLRSYQGKSPLGSLGGSARFSRDSSVSLYSIPDRLHGESGYMSSPERGGGVSSAAGRYPPGPYSAGSSYEDPYYSQYSGTVTPVIDEEASDTELLEESYSIYGVKPPGRPPPGPPRSPFPPGAPAPLPPGGQSYDATRIRVEHMERQLANLTGLVQKALTHAPHTSPAPRDYLQVPAGRDPYVRAAGAGDEFDIHSSSSSASLPDDSYLRTDVKPPKLGKDKSVSFEKSVSFSDEPPDMNSPKQHSPQHAADTKPTKPAIKSSTLPRMSSQERDRHKPTPPPKPAALVAGQYVYRDLALTPEMYNQLRGLQKKAKDLRQEVRNLRRMSQAQAHTVRETIRDTFITIRAMLLSGGDAAWTAGDSEKIRLSREEDLYKQEMIRLEKDLTELESTVEELRGNVINRKTRVNMSDVEEMALILSKSSKTVADLKVRFPSLQEGMKGLLSSEMEKVVREEKFLKEEPERLESALRRCKKLTGTLVTLKRLASVQEQRLPNATSVDAEETPPITPTSAQHSKAAAPVPAERTIVGSASIVGGGGHPHESSGPTGHQQRPENALDALLDELQTFSRPGSQMGQTTTGLVSSSSSVINSNTSNEVGRMVRPGEPSAPGRAPYISDIGRKGSVDSSTGMIGGPITGNGTMLGLPGSLLPGNGCGVNNSGSGGTLRRLHSYPSSSDTDTSPPIARLQVSLPEQPSSVVPIISQSQSFVSHGYLPQGQKPPVPERNADLLQLASARRVPPPPPPRTSSRSPLASPTSPQLPPRNPCGIQSSTVGAVNVAASSVAGTTLRRPAARAGLVGKDCAVVGKPPMALPPDAHTVSTLDGSSGPLTSGCSNDRSVVTSLCTALCSTGCTAVHASHNSPGLVLSTSNSSSCESVNSQEGLQSKRGRQEQLEQRHQELLRKQKALQEQYARLQQLQRNAAGLTTVPPAPPDLLKKTGSESNLLAKMGLGLSAASSGSLTSLTVGKSANISQEPSSAPSHSPQVTLSLTAMTVSATMTTLTNDENQIIRSDSVNGGQKSHGSDTLSASTTAITSTSTTTASLSSSSSSSSSLATVTAAGLTSSTGNVSHSSISHEQTIPMATTATTMTTMMTTMTTMAASTSAAAATSASSNNSLNTASIVLGTTTTNKIYETDIL